MGDVICLPTYQAGKIVAAEWSKRYAKMSKLELLDEMVVFQDEVGKNRGLSIPLMWRGKVLFELLRGCAETQEFSIFVQKYLNHIELQIKDSKGAIGQTRF